MKEIEIPKGYEARIEGNKVIFKPKESEDERINRAIFKALSKKAARDVLIAERIQVSDALAYLERQKEQNPVEITPNQFDGITYGMNGYSSESPAEWSEEDEYCRNLLIVFCENCMEQDSVAIRCANWLKSLYPQPKGEIYKSAKHDLAIRFMNYLDENRPDGKMSLSSGECEDIDKAFKENDWAKIIRYVEKYGTSWKPSEEQVEAMKASYLYWRGATNVVPRINILESLYNDLKKLI